MVQDRDLPQSPDRKDHIKDERRMMESDEIRTTSSFVVRHLQEAPMIEHSLCFLK
jgi:hypothetical protein